MTSRALRFLFYTENVGAGGSERYLRDLAGGFVDRGHHVRIGCNSDPALATYLRSIRPNMKVDSLPVFTPGASLAVRVGRQAGGETAPYMRWLWPAGAAAYRAAVLGPNIALLTRWIARHKPDILHINNGGYPAGESCRAAALAGRLAGVPVVTMAVHSIARPRSWPRLQETAVDHLVRQSLTTIVTASKASADTLVFCRGFPRKKIMRIPYGVEPLPTPMIANHAERSKLGLPVNGLLVGMVGRLDPGKGQQVLLEAAVTICHEMADVYVIIAGSGPEEDAYRTIARNLGLANRVIFTGYCANVYQMMQTFDVLVVPSVGYESLPYILLEGMSAGLPIVGSRIAGIAEAIEDGKSGLLVQPGDVNALAAALSRLIQDPDARQRLGNGAHARAQAEYTAVQMVERTNSHYLHVLAKATSHGTYAYGDGNPCG